MTQLNQSRDWLYTLCSVTQECDQSHKNHLPTTGKLSIFSLSPQASSPHKFYLASAAPAPLHHLSMKLDLTMAKLCSRKKKTSEDPKVSFHLHLGVCLSTGACWCTRLVTQHFVTSNILCDWSHISVNSHGFFHDQSMISHGIFG